MKGRVLVVDDDPSSWAEMLGIVLRQEGFEPVFVRSGDQATYAFHQATWTWSCSTSCRPARTAWRSAVSCGWSPGADRHADRQDRHRRRGPWARVRADDYITKPFSAKGKAGGPDPGLLRRRDTDGAETLRFHDIEMDAAHQVTKDGKPVNLTPLEFELLATLAVAPRQVFTREVLLEQVWGYRYAGDTRPGERARPARRRPRSRTTRRTCGWCRSQRRRLPDRTGGRRRGVLGGAGDRRWDWAASASPGSTQARVVLFTSAIGRGAAAPRRGSACPGLAKSLYTQQNLLTLSSRSSSDPPGRGRRRQRPRHRAGPDAAPGLPSGAAGRGQPNFEAVVLRGE